MGKLESAVMKTKKLNVLIQELNELYDRHENEKRAVLGIKSWLQRIQELQASKRKEELEISRLSENAVELLLKARDESPLHLVKRSRLVTQAKGYMSEVDCTKTSLDLITKDLIHAETIYNELIGNYPDIDDKFNNTSYLYWEKWKECKILAMSIDRDLGTSISQLFSVQEVSRFGEITLNDITSNYKIEEQIEEEPETVDEDQFTIDDVSEVLGQKYEKEAKYDNSVYDEGDDFDVYV